MVPQRPTIGSFCRCRVGNAYFQEPISSSLAHRQTLPARYPEAKVWGSPPRDFVIPPGRKGVGS
jgi:hypothetical protein